MTKTWVTSLPITVTYYLDNNQEKWGKEFLGRKVFSPTILMNEDAKSAIIFVASSYYDDIVNQLKEFGFHKNENVFHIQILNHNQKYLPGHYYSPIPSMNEINFHDMF